MSVPKVRVSAAQLSVEGLLKLLGGSAEDRLKFWEIMKGITSRQNVQIANRNLASLSTAAKAMQTSVKSLQKVAKSSANG